MACPKKITSRLLNRQHGGLSIQLITVSGIIAAAFLVITVFTIRMIVHKVSPDVKSIDRLLVKRQYKNALDAIRSKKVSNKDSSLIYLAAGKVWLAVAWEKMNLDEWRSYGLNEHDWFDLPEASMAERNLSAAADVPSTSADAHYYLGILYMEKGWYERAEMEFLETLRIRPSEIRARQNLGVLYWKMGRNQQAKAELLDAYQADTSNTSVIKNLAVMYRFYLKQPDSAMLWANRYLNLEPKGDFDAYSIREEFDKMQKRYPELTPDEPLKWKKEPKFKARNSGK